MPALLLALPALASLLVDALVDRHRERAFGFSRQTFGQWFASQTHGTLLVARTLPVFMTALSCFVRRTGAASYVRTTAETVAFLTFVKLVSPIVIEALFNIDTSAVEGQVLDARPRTPGWMRSCFIGIRASTDGSGGRWSGSNAHTDRRGPTGA